MTTVFVTDGDERPALAIVRSLGRRGFRVIVGEDRPASLASSSKYCARHVTYPSPYRHRDAFDQFLEHFLARGHVDVVLPVTDVTADAVCRNQDRLRRYCSLPVPPFAAFDLVTNKARVVEYAAKCGVPVPPTQVLDGGLGLDAVLDGFAYPVAVKPVRSRTPTAQGWLRGCAHYANGRTELQRLFAEHEYLAFSPSLIQKRIVGPGVGLFALFDHGRLVGDFAHRRLREKPPAGGVSVLCESVPVDPRLHDFAIRMLGPIGWHGVVMMEYKQDRRTGDFFLIEVNGRFWGSLQLAIDAGVDFPFLSCQLARGVQPDMSAPYKIGVKNRWLLGDLDHLLLRLSRSAGVLGLAADAPSRARTVLDFLKFAQRGLHYEVISGTDWRPFAHEVRAYVRGLRPSPGRSRRSRADAPASVDLSNREPAARMAIES